MRIEVLAFAISAYYDECKAYPPTSNGEDLMKVLEQSPSARKILENLPSVGDGSTRFVDRWGRPMRYSRDGGIGGFPLILSAGKDGKFGTADDIRSDAN